MLFSSSPFEQEDLSSTHISKAIILRHHRQLLPSTSAGGTTQAMSFFPIAKSSTEKGFALFLQTQHDNDTSDEDASDNEADFVDIMVAGILVMTQPVVVPPLLSPTTSTVAAGSTTSVAVALPLKKKRKYKSGSPIWTNPITGIANRLTPFMSQWYIYYIQNAPSQDHRFLCKFRRRFRVP